MKYGPLFVLIAVLTSSCAALGTQKEQQPTAVTTAVVPDCSVVVPDFSAGVGMITLLGKLGVTDFPNQDPTILVNGAEETKRYDPQPNDFIVLAEKPDTCNGTYVAARQISFNLTYGEWRKISGFQSSITDKRLLNALQQVCEGARWNLLDNLRFDGDIVNGGCNFSTGVYVSYADGTTSCEMYESINDAYEGTRSKLDNAKWIEAATNNTGENLCNRTSQP